MRNSFLSIKYLYLNDVFASHRERLVEEALDGATFKKYRLLFDTLPCTFDKLDVVIVGGNDPDRLASFIRVNRPLLNRTPTIAIAGTLSPKKRAELLRLGFDDVMNLKGLATAELAARVIGIFNRYTITDQKVQKLHNYNQSLSEICELDRLTKAQRVVLENLYDASGNFCRYGQLRMLISRNQTSASQTHLRVLIHGIRSVLKPGFVIENVRGLGYRLVADNSPHEFQKN